MKGDESQERPGTIISGNVIAGAVAGERSTAKARNVNINVGTVDSDSEDSVLRAQLDELEKQLRLRADLDNPDQRAAIAAVSQAAKAPNRSAQNDALKNTKAAGRWILSIAEQVGVPLAIAAVKSAIGVSG